MRLACVHPTASSEWVRRTHSELVSLACVDRGHIFEKDLQYSLFLYRRTKVNIKLQNILSIPPAAAPPPWRYSCLGTPSHGQAVSSVVQGWADTGPGWITISLTHWLLDHKLVQHCLPLALTIPKWELSVFYDK